MPINRTKYVSCRGRPGTVDRKRRANFSTKLHGRVACMHARMYAGSLDRSLVNHLNWFSMVADCGSADGCDIWIIIEWSEHTLSIHEELRARARVHNGRPDGTRAAKRSSPAGERLSYDHCAPRELGSLSPAPFRDL